ncbi:hypothetical protein FH608_043465 [Nonomuraea phyllanthi]|uniref:Transposase n=1 Tax=Nonomuraea phyllanthi TaxID=2219224 RepID=A0A5C4VDL1_9ACTN|nr:hypothetical protein FH608_043465 [Nonomuraea phyllanthi]
MSRTKIRCNRSAMNSDHARHNGNAKPQVSPNGRVSGTHRWHRHVTLVAAVHLFLTELRLTSPKAACTV